jgi:hypothetical protein
MSAKKPSKKEEDEVCDVYFNRIMSRMAEGLDTAACAAVAMGVSQTQFVMAARHTFTFVDRWNKATRDQENENK